MNDNFGEMIMKVAKLFPATLKNRQKNILACQLLGLSQEETALYLEISVSTVEADLAKARQRLGAKKTREIFWLAMREL